MIAPIRKRRRPSSAWHRPFLAMLPKIVQHLRVTFRNLPPEARAEAIQEAIANTCIAFARLVKQGRQERAFPTVLAQFAAAQVRDGRRVGTGQNSRDVLSERAQRVKQFVVQRLDHYDQEEESWEEAIVEDPHTPVFDQVWFRIDFPEWLRRLSRRDRQAAKSLAIGNTTTEVAKELDLSAGRVSQLRRELYKSWLEFHGEDGLSLAQRM
jgi:RNA polymerase sigma factor (sigma-70 family)